jgi:hypothetical protein
MHIVSVLPLCLFFLQCAQCWDVVVLLVTPCPVRATLPRLKPHLQTVFVPSFDNQQGNARCCHTYNSACNTPQFHSVDSRNIFSYAQGSCAEGQTFAGTGRSCGLCLEPGVNQYPCAWSCTCWPENCGTVVTLAPPAGGCCRGVHRGWCMYSLIWDTSALSSLSIAISDLISSSWDRTLGEVLEFCVTGIFFLLDSLSFCFCLFVCLIQGPVQSVHAEVQQCGRSSLCRSSVM